MTWNVDNICALRRMWTEGLSCALIAIELGKSRNAVIGKAFRLKLPHREPASIKSMSRAAREPKPVPSMPRKAELYFKLSQPVLKAPAGLGVSIVDVCGCKFPVGAGDVAGHWLFCNAPSHNKTPWCEYHYGVVYQKVNPDRNNKPKRFRIPTSLLRAVA